MNCRKIWRSAWPKSSNKSVGRTLLSDALLKLILVLFENCYQESPSQKRRTGVSDPHVLGLAAPAFLQLFGDFQLPLCVFVSSHIAIGLAQQVVSDGIVGIHAQRVLQGPD